MFCCNCGKELPEGARFCPFCGRELPDGEFPKYKVSYDDGFSALIPRNNPALVAYYTGLFSILFGWVLGPTAIIAGIMGLRHSVRHPEAKGAVHAVVGIVCGIIGLAVWVLLTIFFVSAFK